MSNVAKLKKKAADFELKKDFGKALAVYVELLDNFDANAAELDVSLFNRVGDLMLRQGNVADAVDYYERAVVRYVDGGFYNNAIALCNKILRQSPGRASVYYTLGKISAHKGFTTDAKQNFLEYASRMQSAGNMDEAFRALKEFADLCPGQDDIRLMLAEQLTKLNRKPEALEQLQRLWARYDADGRAGEAAATLERMRAIDPSFEPQSPAAAQQSRPADLVFLDLDDVPPRRPPEPSQRGTSAPPPAPKRPATTKPPPPAAVADLPLLDADEDEPEPELEPVADTPPRELSFEEELSAEGSQDEAVDESIDADAGVEEAEAPDAFEPAGSILDGLEQTSYAPADEVEESLDAPTLDLEPTAFGGYEEPAVEDTAGSLLDASPLEEIAPDPSLLGDSFGSSSDESAPFAVQQDESPLDFALHDASPSALDSGDIVDAFSSDVTADWQSSTDPFGGGDAGAFDVGAPAGDPGSDSPFIDFDTSALDGGGSDAFGGVGAAPAELRKSTMSAARTVDTLRESVDAEPDNWHLRRELAEAMLESGNRDGGIRELEAAMMGAERANELDLASSVAEEIARLSPDTVRFHQKRVEYAFRTNDKLRLIEAYLALAGALLGAQQADKARAVYQRVLDLAPDDIRAQAALESIALVDPEPEPVAPPPRRSGNTRPTRAVGAAPPPAAPVRSRQPDPEPAADADFVNLGDILRSEDAPRSTRMIVDEEEPSGDEEADFADMLKKFKQGIAENVDKEDYQSHYDLGVAFKEMGLLDEAVAEFQKALRAPTNRLPTYEALGQCFIEKEQYSIAATVLARALNEQGTSDDDLVGVLYLLGRAAEALNRPDDALSYYQRVFMVDIEFRDIAERIADVERVAR